MTKPIDEVNAEFVQVEHKEQPMSIATNSSTGSKTSRATIEISANVEKVIAPPGASDDEKSDIENKKVEENKSIEEKHNHPLYYVPWGITSFEELAVYEEAREKSFEISEKAALFPDMVANIMSSEDIKDKQKAIRKAGEEFADMVTDISKKETSKVETKEQKLHVENLTPSSNNPNIFIRLKDRIFGKESEPSQPSSKFMVWKEKDGTYRWFAVYSNNYRDEDIPVQEIISEKSHLAFVEKVNAGDYPYPPLRHYHVPGTEWGQSDFISYDRDTGFAMAAGYVLPGHEAEAEAIAQMDDIALSHGMKEVERASDDSSIITQHRTFEISDLPRSVAANKLTNFYVVEKEINMALTPEVRTYLTNAGIKEEQLTSIEKELDKSQKDAEDQGIERKETDASDGTQSNEKTEKQTSPAFSEAQTIELKAVFESFTENMNKELVTVLAPIVKSLKELEKVEKEEERLKQIVKLSPPKSLESLLFGDESLSGQSASASDDTIIKRGRGTKEGKDGPKETIEKEKNQILNTGDTFKDDLVNGLFDEKELAGIN